MTRNKIILIAVAAAVVVVFSIGIFFFIKSALQNNVGTAPSLAPENITRTIAPTNVVVPDTNTQNVPPDVVKPSEVAPSNASGASYRDYNIQITASAFTPNTVISKLGDTINISFTAADGDYTIVQPDYGLKYTVKNGRSTRAQFTGTATGKFTFYCSSCGGPGKGPVGYFVIVNK